MTPLRLTRKQVREVDRIAIEEYGIPGIVLMENAARGAVEVAQTMVMAGNDIDIICGLGNNGGDGFAIARHLVSLDYEIRVILIGDPANARGDAATNYRVLDAMGVTRIHVYDDVSADKLDSLNDAQLVIDAMFGTGLSRPIEGAAAVVIDRMHADKPLVLSIDIPSGLDCDTGRPIGPCVRATKTVTFVAEKLGFAEASAHEFLGEVVVKDIGIPKGIVHRARLS